MATLNDILKDTATYPDTFEVDFMGAKVPLSSLRQFTAAELGEIDKQRKQVAKELADATKQRQSAMDLSTQAQQLFDSLQSKPNATATQVADDPWESDPVYAPVRSRLTDRDKKLDEFKSALDRLTKAQEQIATIGGWERWERQYNSFPEARRPKDKSLEEIVKFAHENKLVDRFGIPSVQLALDKLTEASRLEDIRKTAHDEGVKEAETRLRASTMPRPNFNPSPAVRAGKTPLEDLDHLTDKVLEDPELRQLVEGLNIQ